MEEQETLASLSDAVHRFLLIKGIDSNGYKLKNGKPDGTYYPKIISFYRYLKQKVGFKDDVFALEKLTDLDMLHIEESMNFYIEESRESNNPADHIRKKGVLLTYCIVIAEFYKFLSVNGIKNTVLLMTYDLWDDDPQAFSKVINKVAKQYNLVDALKTTEPISEDDFEFLCKICDDTIEKKFNNNPLKNPNYYKGFVVAVMIKLMLYTGIRCLTLASIKIFDLDFDYNTIQINGFTVHLPHNLRNQLWKYHLVRKIILETYNQKSIDSLFVWFDGSLGKAGRSNEIGSNAFFTWFLKRYLGRNDITGISKFVIISMIEKGVNQSIIESFTGYKSDIYDYCQVWVTKQKNPFERNRYLDSRLRSIETFDEL